MSAAARLKRGAVILLASNIGGAFLSFLLAALIARSLGETSFGIYSAVSAWIYPLAILADMGISTLMTRDLGESPALANQMAYTALLWRILIGGGILLAILGFAPLLSDEPLVIMGLQLSAPMVVILPMFSTLSAIFKAVDAIGWVLALNIGMLAVQLALTAAAIAGGGTIMDVTVLNVLTSLGQLLAAVLIEKRYIGRAPLARWPSGRDMQTMLRASFPFAASAALSAVQMRAAVIALESLSSLAAVGLFAAMTRFTDAARLAPNALFGAMMPVLASISRERDAREHTFNRILAGLLAFGAACIIGSLALGGWAIGFVYGGAFADGFPVLFVLVLALAIGTLRGAYTLYEFAVRREHMVNAVNLLSLALQIILGLLLIPGLGALGAAWSVLAAESIALACLAWSRSHRA